MKRMYFEHKDSEFCFSKEYFIEKAKEAGLNEVELFLAEEEKIDGIFYCKEFQLITESGICGKCCENYNPRNGRSGICKSKSNALFYPSEKIKIKIKKV
jgi:hypothetical protein